MAATAQYRARTAAELDACALAIGAISSLSHTIRSRSIARPWPCAPPLPTYRPAVEMRLSLPKRFGARAFTSRMARSSRGRKLVATWKLCFFGLPSRS